MGFSFDEFLNSTKEFVGNTTKTISNVNDFFKSEEIQPLVKVSKPPQGNLTAAQIEAGKTAKPAPLPAVEDSFLKKSFYGIPVIALLGLGAFYFMKKRRG